MSEHDSLEYLSNLRHSCAHLLAAAVMELFPSTHRTIGPSIENGFYFDFEFQEPLTDDDLPKIEAKMHEIVKSWKGFEKQELSAQDAKDEYPGNKYKHELIEEFSEHGKKKISFYKSGSYRDLCKGGHIEHPDQELKFFKLTSLAGAYWKGSEKNAMLTRIYGTVWPTQAELDVYLLQQEEAKKRDHRKIGRELELFFIDDMVGKGLVMWLPKGTILRDQVEKLAKEKEHDAGYQRVASPHIAREELFLTSGHLPYYKDSMYPPMEMDDGTYYLKAMNCPHHHRMFLFRPRSYREFPIRFAEYGTCYRNELSGTLQGLLRVRGMTMNDAHIYIRKDQIKDEFKKVLQLTQEYFDIFGLKDYWFRLSKWSPAHPEKYINEPKNWEYSEQMLREVLQEMKVKFVEVDDEAAFYGPKVDVQFKSVIGREETMSTIQLDFLAKARFNLNYIDSEGKENNDVFVIHRAPLSVHERFMAFLIEHFAGAFPLWLSPVQVAIVPISQDQHEYAATIQQKLDKQGIRVEVYGEAESMQNRIRKAAGQKIPYILVVGKKEVEDGTVSVRQRGSKESTVVKVEEFASKVNEEVNSRVI
ncbi:MAG: threonine--tRNA ligase [Patescibacteria group bacterium]